MTSKNPGPVRWIPIERVRVLNPRARGRAKYQDMVANIERVGLKKPITVAERVDAEGRPYYATGCGEGRLKAFIELDQTEIPAMVVDATDEDLLLISLTENLARRRGVAVDQMGEFVNLKQRGYSAAQIAAKVGLEQSYVNAVLRLLKCGETRLVQAVVRRQIPLRIALSVATESDQDVQRLLREAYESKSLRGGQLLLVRKLISRRRLAGKSLRARSGAANGQLTSNDLVRTFHREVARQRAAVAKARLCETRLEFLVSGLQELLEDEDFVTVLRAESLDSLPKCLAERMNGKEPK